MQFTIVSAGLVRHLYGYPSGIEISAFPFAENLLVWVVQKSAGMS